DALLEVVEGADLDVHLELMLEVADGLLVDVVRPVVEDQRAALAGCGGRDRLADQRELGGGVERRDRDVAEVRSSAGGGARLGARREDRGQARDRDRRTSRPVQELPAGDIPGMPHLPPPLPSDGADLDRPFSVDGAEYHRSTALCKVAVASPDMPSARPQVREPFS